MFVAQAVLAGVVLANQARQRAAASSFLPLLPSSPSLLNPRRQCSLLDSDYSQIFADLAPFRTAGISAADVAAAAAALPATGMLALVGGEAWEEGPDGELGAPTRRMWGGIRYYKKLLADFESDLPDMKVLINFGDKPRSWTGAVPPADADALARGALSVQDAWERHGCDAAVGAGMRCKHGLFQPGPFFGARGPLPIFSGWRIDGCFSGEGRGACRAHRRRPQQTVQSTCSAALGCTAACACPRISLRNHAVPLSYPCPHPTIITHYPITHPRSPSRRHPAAACVEQQGQRDAADPQLGLPPRWWRLGEQGAAGWGGGAIGFGETPIAGLPLAPRWRRLGWAWHAGLALPHGGWFDACGLVKGPGRGAA